VKKLIKVIRDKKAKGYDDVPGNILKVLGELFLKITTQLLSITYETVE
jgi:hypothetical protein